MTTGTVEVLRLGAGILLAAGTYPLHRVSQRLDPQLYWWALPLADVRFAALAAGALVGLALPDHLGASLNHVAGMGLVFVAGWLGLTAGCGLDLRVLRRHRPAPLLYEAAEAPALLVVLAVLVFASSQFLGVPSGLNATTGVFLVAAMCMAGDPLPSSRTSRKTSGPKHGFWRPGASAMAAIALVAVGAAFTQAPPLSLRLPGVGALHPVLIESAGLRIWWGLVLGGVAGLLCDLATKEDFALEGLYYLLAAVILLCSGMAAALGLEPLLVGGVAGLWLINATLRRMDVVHVLDRGQAAPRLAVPVLAGWGLGQYFPGGGWVAVDWTAWAVALIAVVGLRPLAKLWELNRSSNPNRAGTRSPGSGPGRRAEDLAARLEVGELPVLVALVLSRYEPHATGWSVLFALVLGQAVLAVAAARLRRPSAEAMT